MERESVVGSRVWLMPPVIILLLMMLAYGITRLFFAESLIQFMTSIIAPIAAIISIGIWLAVFSRLPIRDRAFIPTVLVGSLAIASQMLHASMVPIGIIMYVLPTVMILPIIWLSLVPGPFSSFKRSGTYVLLLVPFLPFFCMRIDGIDGSMAASVSYRWKPSSEDTYLASLNAAKTDLQHALTQQASTGELAPLVSEAGDWPGFRGVNRDAVATGLTVAEDWFERELKELWRRPIGPGWSSFAVVGNRLFTQEQRGDHEAVICMNADTGETLWVDTTPERFYEVVGNAGPRATPTFDAGRIYALGATGKLTALDARTGKRFWQADIVADTGANIPMWGFSSSPLLVDGNTVLVIAGEPGAKVIAYDADSGQVLWKALEKGLSYSSPQLMEIDQVRQVIVMDGHGVFALEPDSGKTLWTHLWPIQQAARMVQPLQLDPYTLLVGSGYGLGTRKLNVRRKNGGWLVEESWTSRDMKPYFNDYVAHKGFLYGFDHEMIACIDLSTGQRMWKKGRYGFGQMLLEPERDLLIVLGEKGELVFLKATPEKSEAGEVNKIKALEGKTWNHPVLVKNRLYLRNAEEAVCYEAEGSSEQSPAQTSALSAE